MNILQITIAVVVVILIIGRFKKNKMANPINSISFYGCMGFRLGDRKDFVLSRIRHLKLMNTNEQETYNMHVEFGSNVGSFDYVSTSTGLFNNIESVSFHFNRDLLSAVMIGLSAEQADIETIARITKRKINQRLGVPYQENGNMAIWIKPPYSVNMDVSEQAQTAFLYIADQRLDFFNNNK